MTTKDTQRSAASRSVLVLAGEGPYFKNSSYYQGTMFDRASTHPLAAELPQHPLAGLRLTDLHYHDGGAWQPLLRPKRGAVPHLTAYTLESILLAADQPFEVFDLVDVWEGNVQELLRLDVELKVYVEDVFSSLRRKGWQERSHAYLTGLMLDGRRKSVEPMAARLGEANDQSLGHFLANTPWDSVPVRARLARKMHKAIDPAGWVFDDTGFRKDGRMSPCVARQYTGTAGKITNCQVATTLHLASDQACPIDWRLFMPESWDPDSDKASDDVHQRRAAAGIPDDEHHRPKWQLALECVDEALSWRVPAPPVVAADAGYGDAAGFRHALTERGVAYAVQISHTLTVLPATAARTTPPYCGQGPRPKPRYEQDAVSVKKYIIALGWRQAKRITWRTGSKQQQGESRVMSGRFVFCRVRQADAGTRLLHKGQDLPECWLIAEWPPGEAEPTRYWLSTLPPDTHYTDLVRAAKLRWRIEHDYRELKTGLGLAHYEGRKWAGWHHHVTLVAAAHGFLTLQRLNPQAPVPE